MGSFFLFQLFWVRFSLVVSESSNCLRHKVARVAFWRLGRMMPFHVSIQTDCTLEMVFALIALEWRLSNIISTDVTCKSLLGGAGNIANRTKKTCFFRFHDVPFHEMRFCKCLSCESLWTLRTPKWPFPRMLPHVGWQVSFFLCLVLTSVTRKTLGFRSVFWNTPVQAFFN